MTTIRQLAEALSIKSDTDSRDAATLLLSLADADESMPRVEWRVEGGVEVDVVKRSDALAPLAAKDAEIAALRADAERYRWLRGRVPGGTYRIMGVIYSEGGSGVDAAIDAARAKESSNGR